MPAPSQLAIATSSVSRLIKEEASYHKELEQQEKRLEKLEQTAEGENAEFQINQERKALAETRAMFPELRQRIITAAAQLKQRIDEQNNANAEELNKANDTLNAAELVT